MDKRQQDFEKPVEQSTPNPYVTAHNHEDLTDEEMELVVGGSMTEDLFRFLTGR